MASTLYNDGTGTHLYVGGRFTILCGAFGRAISRYDGERFTGVGNVVIGTPASETTGRVYSLTVLDPDGIGPRQPLLIAAGRFDAIVPLSGPRVPAKNVAAFDGTTWTALGLGLFTGDGVTEPAGYVAQVTPADLGAGPVLVAVGDFTVAPNRRDVAVWNGTAWLPLGEGDTGAATEARTVEYRAIVSSEGNVTGGIVFIGGDFASFTTSGMAIPHSTRLVAFGPMQWAGVGTGLPTPPPPLGPIVSVTRLRSFDPDGTGPLPPLLFIRTELGSTLNVLAWNGSAFANVGCDQSCNTDFAVHDDGAGPALYATSYTPSNGRAALVLRRYDGVGSFLPVGPPILGLYGGQVAGLNLASIDLSVLPVNGMGRRLMVMGLFEGTEQVPSQNVVRWNRTTYESPIPISRGGLDMAPSPERGTSIGASAAALARADLDGPGPLPERIYVGGTFTRAGNRFVRNVAVFTSSGWEEAAPDAGLSGSLNYESDRVLQFVVAPGPIGDRVFAATTVVEPHPTPVNPGDTEVFTRVDVLQAASSGGAPNSWVPVISRVDGFGRLAYVDSGAGARLHVTNSSPATGSCTVRSVDALGALSQVGATLNANDGSADLIEFQGSLFLGCGVTTVMSAQVARWSGSAWVDASMGLPTAGQPRFFVMSGSLYALTAFNPQVFRWTGTAWLAHSAQIGMFVEPIGVADLGAGPRLFMSGRTVADNRAFRSRLLALEGTNVVDYSLMNEAEFVGAPTAVLPVVDRGRPGLLFAGGFFGVGGTRSEYARASHGIAFWACSAPPIPDGGVTDAGTIDGGTADAGSGLDASVDGGAIDAGLNDGGRDDGGIDDAGMLDAGLMDAGLPDGGLVDAGMIDAGADAGPPGSADAGGAPARDAGSAVDSGRPDAGMPPDTSAPGCGCGTEDGVTYTPLLFVFLALLRRRKASRGARA